MRYEHEVMIWAPTELVWELTVDVEAWPSFSPTMRSVRRLDSGPFGLGSRARVKQPGQSAVVWTVTKFEAGREFSWQAKRVGLTMIGTHRATPVENGTRNTLILEVTGALAGTFRLLFARLFAHALSLENAGFKATAQRLNQERQEPAAQP